MVVLRAVAAAEEHKALAGTGLPGGKRQAARMTDT